MYSSWAHQMAAASNAMSGNMMISLTNVGYNTNIAPGVVPIGGTAPTTIPGPAPGAVPIASGGGGGAVAGGGAEGGGERTITIVEPTGSGGGGGGLSSAPPDSEPRPSSSSVPLGVDSNNVVVANVELLKRARSMKEIGPESDFVQRIMGFLRVCIDTYSIVISSLLSVFVPQFCKVSDEDQYCLLNPSTADCLSNQCVLNSSLKKCRPHECTTQENFEDLIPYNKFVLGWNFIALGVALIHYFIVWSREKWLIRYLDVSPIHSRVNLRHVIKYYPELEEGLNYQNRRTMVSSIVWLIVAVINVIVSGILVFKYYYNNERTVTTFITSVLIIGQLSYQALEITMLGLRHQVALSCLQFEPLSFNIIDKDYKGKPDPTRMASAAGSVGGSGGLDHQPSVP